MDDATERLRRRISAAHTEALRVGDSPLRSDQVAKEVGAIRAELDERDLGEERVTRIAAALDDALRVLRRDDDGREAAKHLQTALRQLPQGPQRPSPFLDP
jgi:hypothetical protein